MIHRVDSEESLAAEVNRPGGPDKILLFYDAPSPFLNVPLFSRKIQGYELPEKHFVLRQFESEMRTVVPEDSGRELLQLCSGTLAFILDV